MKAEEIFTPAFLNLDPQAVVAGIKRDGYFVVESALHESFLNRIESDIAGSGLGLNKNGIGGVYADTQFYVTHMLAVSDAFFSYCTNSKVFEICSRALGEHFRLKALRYYETFGGHHMQWHTDNKTDKGVKQIPGLIFIAYVSDTFEGEFQYVRGSHLWSGTKAYNDYSDDFIAREHKNEIINFKAAKGTVIVYDTYGIHRACPVEDRQYVRKSLFFQVDNEIEKSEPIIVNTEYIHALDEKLKMYLGFGRGSGYESYPNTSLNSLRINPRVLRMMAGWIGFRVARKAARILPSSLRSSLKGLLVRH